MKVEIRRGDEGGKDPGVIPTRFKRYVHRKGKKRGKLNALTPESKLIAALGKALAIQGKRDKKNYYVEGESIWCPDITVTGEDGKQSVKAKGRFRIGKIAENLTFGVMDFDIRFRDSKDPMGLPDIVIEHASMEELPKDASLNP